MTALQLASLAVAAYVLLCCWLTVRQVSRSGWVSLARGAWTVEVRVWWIMFTCGAVVLNRGEIIEIHFGFITVTVRHDRYVARQNARRKADAKADAKAVESLLASLPRKVTK
jgi:hypothetical protein